SHSHRESFRDRRGNSKTREASWPSAAHHALDIARRNAARTDRLAYRDHESFVLGTAHRRLRLREQLTITKDRHRAHVGGCIQRERDHEWSPSFPSPTCPPAYRSRREGSPSMCCSVTGT